MILNNLMVSPIYGLNRTKLRTYVKLNYLKLDCSDTKTAYLCEIELLEIELF